MPTRRAFILQSALATAGYIAGSTLLNSCRYPAHSENVYNKPDNFVRELHERLLTIDSHCDTPLNFLHQGFDISKNNSSLPYNSKVDFPRMKTGGLDASFFAVFLWQGIIDTEHYAKNYNRAIKIFDAIKTNIANNPTLAEQAFEPDDADRIARSGKRAIFIGVENGYPIGDDLNKVKIFYKLGARYITLCHIKNNQICDSSTDKAGAVFHGLSPFGEKVVKEMNRLGIMVDISHTSDETVNDVLKLSTKPIIASHSCAHSICGHPRNLNDELLQKIAKNGGVVQLCFLSNYIKKAPHNPQRDSALALLRNKFGTFSELLEEQMKIARAERENIDKIFPEKLATVANAVDHIDHIVRIAGIDHIGIGTDFDGGGGLADCFDATQLPNITGELMKRGYTEEQMRKIWGGNLLRVFREVSKV